MRTISRKMQFQTASLSAFKCHAVVPRGVLCLRRSPITSAHAPARSVVGNGVSAICRTPRGRQALGQRLSGV